MKRMKRRPKQHMMEEESLLIIRERLPEEWALHEYQPDYGIDRVVEVFQYTDDTREVAETLGELFFVQAKSIKKCEARTVKVYPRKNVAKTELEEDKSEYMNIDTIPFQLETSELTTVQSMGAAVPVLLVLVCLDTKRTFFVCLNDLIDKVLVPADPEFYKQGSKVIHIPIGNEIITNEDSLVPLRFYAKRAKLYAAFSVFAYQRHELRRNPSGRLLHRFLQILREYDFWETTEMWKPILDLHKELNELAPLVTTSLEYPDEFWHLRVFPIWDRLCNLSNMYEELCREWFLPTFLSHMMSYKDVPEVHKENK